MIIANVFAVTMKFESIEIKGSRQNPSSYLDAYDPSLGSLENMIAYFKKGAEVIGSVHRSDAYDVFPRFENVRTNQA